VNNDPASTEIIVKLAPAAVQAGGAVPPNVKACAAEAGISLEPLHPSTSDSELASYFRAFVNTATVQPTVERLLRCEAVEGAYPKPRGEAPERTP
jgi:hypothetical protein